MKDTEKQTIAELIQKNKKLTEQLSEKEEQLSEKDKKIESLSDKVSQQAIRIKELERMKFGHSRERFTDANQLSLFEQPADKAVEQAVEKVKAEIEEETITYTRCKPAPRGEGIKFSGEVKEEHIIVEPEENVEGMQCIGEEITLNIEYKPAQLIKTYYHRKKYITPEDSTGHCRQVIAPLSNGIEKCLASTNLLSHIAVSKFVDHLPLYRQLKIFERYGITIPTSTLESWIRICSRTLRLLYAVQKETVLVQDYLQVDESPIRVLDNDKKGATHLGYMWVYHAVLSKMVYFEYRKGRSGEFPQENLSKFKGYLQTDGYSGYLQFEKQDGITHLGCWAHARRKFEHALDNDKERATIILHWIQQLYTIEREAVEKGLSPEGTKTLRLEKSLPIINLIGKYILQENNNVLPKSSIGVAFTYCTERWSTLSNYIMNGLLQIDNNLVENAIRPLALGRKNYLFAGSHAAAEDIAMYYSFFASCKAHNINPETWLSFVLGHITDAKPSQYVNLLPANFKPE